MSVVKRWSCLAPEGIKRVDNECDKNPIARDRDSLRIATIGDGP